MNVYRPLLALLETRRLLAEAEARRAAGLERGRAKTEEEEEEERRKRRRFRGDHGFRDPSWLVAIVAAMPPVPPFAGDSTPPRGTPSGDAGDGVPVSTSTSDAFRNQGLEAYWTQLSGVWAETDSLEHVSGGSPAILQYNPNTTATTTRSDIGLVATADGSQGVGARLSFAGGLLSGYVMRAEVGFFRLYRYDAGVATLLRSYTGTLAPGDTMGIFASSTTIRGRKNAANQASSTDATYASGFTAILSFSAGAQFSSFATNL